MNKLNDKVEDDSITCNCVMFDEHHLRLFANVAATFPALFQSTAKVSRDDYTKEHVVVSAVNDVFNAAISFCVNCSLYYYYYLTFSCLYDCDGDDVVLSHLSFAIINFHQFLSNEAQLCPVRRVK